MLLIGEEKKEQRSQKFKHKVITVNEECENDYQLTHYIYIIYYIYFPICKKRNSQPMLLNSNFKETRTYLSCNTIVTQLRGR